MAFLKITKPKEYSRVLTEALRFGKKKGCNKNYKKRKRKKKNYTSMVGLIVNVVSKS